MDRNKILMIVLYVILVVGVLIVGWKTNWFGLSKSNEEPASGYQAVFLTNGQVYFGKLTGTSGQYATLKDIYYLQVQQQVQPTDENSQQQPNLTLVKLGNELHGPVDEMKINRDAILFWENLKSDGKVVEAIDRYKKEGPSAPAATTAPSPSVTQ